MAKYICLLVIGLGLAAQPCRAQENDEWSVTVGAVHRIYLYQHDALQRRADDDVEGTDFWRDGEIDGSGTGIRVAVGRGDGTAVIVFVRSDHEYELLVEEEDSIGDGVGLHFIDTERRDFDVHWEQVTGRNERGVWGWMLGFRYLGLQKELTVIERGYREDPTTGNMVYRDSTISGDGNIVWYLVQTGYFGELLPFGGRYMKAYANINVLAGEVSGPARKGNDEDYDGLIQETYEDEYSVAYGLNGTVGLGLTISRTIRVALEYQREWLYSFKSTDSGIVMFPDNNDALFIENTHSLHAHLAVIF